MALPKPLVQPFRRNMLLIGSGWRGYFAPFNIALSAAQNSTSYGPTLLDLTQGPFDSNNPQNYGFVDCGWIKDFKLTPGSKIGQIRSGYRGAVRAQYRGQVEESFDFKFNEYGRLQYQLATGTNVINLLLSPTPSTVGPISATGYAAVGITAYSGGVAPYGNNGGTAATVTLSAAPSGVGISVGSYIVCDQDYTVGTYGIVGDAGTPVYQNAVTDINYIRKNSDYVARVTAIQNDNRTCTLDQPFIGGGSGNPAPVGIGSTSNPQYKVQAIVGWAAREGGTFIQDWTGLFLLNTVDNAQIAVYYPHISISANKDITTAFAIENVGTTDLTAYQLEATFEALAYDDPLDGETVVGYKAYYARPQQNTY